MEPVDLVNFGSIAPGVLLVVIVVMIVVVLRITRQPTKVEQKLYKNAADQYAKYGSGGPPDNVPQMNPEQERTFRINYERSQQERNRIRNTVEYEKSMGLTAVDNPFPDTFRVSEQNAKIELSGCLTIVMTFVVATILGIAFAVWKGMSLESASIVSSAIFGLCGLWSLRRYMKGKDW